MFTVKLYDGDRLQLIEADSVTVRDDGPYLRRVTCVRADVTTAYDVGIVTRETANRAANVVYTHAIVENADGRTTEVIRTRSIPPASERLAYPPHPSEHPESSYVGRDPLSGKAMTDAGVVFEPSTAHGEDL